MAISGNQRHSGDPLQSGDAYKKKNFNRIWLMVFGLAVVIVVAYAVIAHLYFSRPDPGKAGTPHSAPGMLLISTRPRL